MFATAPSALAADVENRLEKARLHFSHFSRTRPSSTATSTFSGDNSQAAGLARVYQKQSLSRLPQPPCCQAAEPCRLGT